MALYVKATNRDSQANLLDASRMNNVCSVVCTSVANDARNANRCSFSWKKDPMMQNAE